MRDIQKMISDAADALRPLIEEAFAAGKDEGRREAADEFKAKIGAILGEESAPSKPSTPSVTGAPDEEARAPSGTVKPAVLRLIRESQGGITTTEITRLTGFKHNSIRGTLWGLQKEGKITKRGNRWVGHTASDAEPEQRPASSNHYNSQGDDYDETRFSLGV